MMDGGSLLDTAIYLVVFAGIAAAAFFAKPYFDALKENLNRNAFYKALDGALGQGLTKIEATVEQILTDTNLQGQLAQIAADYLKARVPALSKQFNATTLDEVKDLIVAHAAKKVIDNPALAVVNIGTVAQDISKITDVANSITSLAKTVTSK